MFTYKNRIFDTLLKEALESKGAVVVRGPKWCGKTTTAEQVAKSVVYMHDPEMAEQNLLTAQTRPYRLSRWVAGCGDDEARSSCIASGV